MSDPAFVVLAVVLVVIAAVIACIDAAMGRVSRVAAEQFLREARRGSKALVAVTSDPARYRNVLLLVRTAAELGATCAAAVAVTKHFGQGPRALTVAALIMTVASYVVIGVSARTVGRQRADQVALASAGLTVGLTKLFGPLPRLLILFGNAVTPGRGYPEGPFATEAELRDLVDRAEASGVVERSERDMITGIFELGDTLVREVMVPRPDMVVIEKGKTIKQALALALRSGFSRIPVVGESTDDVVGVAYLKDLARRVQDGKEDEKVETVMRSATYVPDSKPVDELLRDMQKARIHLAIVVDEYGGTAGLVTIEDILEEIVGEITDEYDRADEPVEWLEDGAVRVTARLPIEDLNELFDTDIDVEDVDTVGGLLAAALGRVPIPGAVAKVDGLVLTAESAKGRRNRIGTVLVRRVSDGPAHQPRPKKGSEKSEPAQR